uniref:FA core complex associated protein 100 n=1 Tax=Nomascus leucogenys TaxID=61853 RepID=G1RTW6_NOMLE
MAGAAPRVRYLAGFCCPLGGLAAGKPRVLCHEAEVFLSTGSELVYVYDQEGGLLTVSAGPRGREGAGGGPARWKMQLFEQPCPGEDPRPGGQIGEVELSSYTPPAGVPGKPAAPHFLPVLCCVSPSGSGVPHDLLGGSGGFTLEDALFGLLFGADATLLQSPVVLCGLPDGQLCCVILKALVTSRSAPGDPNALVKILHHLEEPVIFIGALKTELQVAEAAENFLPDEDVHCDCLVALGHHGRMLAIKSGKLVPELREYCLPGPVLCAACGGGGRVYHSTPSDLCVVDLSRGSTPLGPEQPEEGPGGLPPMLCPASLNICSVVSLSASPRTHEGGTKLLALSAKGRLMTCSLDLDSEMPGPARMTTESAGRKIKELLSGIGNISERVSFLKKAVDQRNKALTSLNEAMNVSCALLSSGTGPRPISCTTSTTWNRLQTQDVLMATCVLENSSNFSLDQGWTLCIQVLTSSCALDLDSACSAITYTIPVDQLGPGARREVTLPLGPGETGGLDLPVTVSCTLFYSLREVVGGALAPSDSEDPFLDECPSDVLPEQEGVCLPLSRHTVDMLQCLRFPGLAPPHTRAPSPLGPTHDPVATFLETCREPGSQPAGPASLRAEYLPPSVASIKVSAELLRAALKDGHSDPLCCRCRCHRSAADGYLDVPLAGSEVAPVLQVAMTDLCPAGPIQAVEIQVESSSLADICRAHHAVIGRMQTMVTEQAAQGSSAPDLRVQYLRQIHANHETLLREVQTLRDRLCTEDEASSCATAQRLLQVYRQLRHPSLILL